MEFCKPARIHEGSVLLRNCIRNNLWICQHKLDGMRAKLFAQDGKVYIQTKSGDPIKNYKPPTIPQGCCLDGEFYQGNYYAFDCLQFGGEWITRRPLENRLSILDVVKVVMRVPEIGNKRTWKKQAEQAGSEGVVFKHLQKPYEFGTTTNWLKIRL